MWGFEMLCEYGDAGPFDPREESEDSRWCDTRPAVLGVRWPLGSQVSVCIRSELANRAAVVSGRTGWLLWEEKSNKEPLEAGMLSKVDKGEFWIPEYCERIDCVEIGDEDRLCTARSASKSKSSAWNGVDVVVGNALS
jgi:hypothetical protein